MNTWERRNLNVSTLLEKVFGIVNWGNFGQRGNFDIFSTSVYCLCTKNFQMKYSYCEVQLPMFMTWISHCEILCTETEQRCWKIGLNWPRCLKLPWFTVLKMLTKPHFTTSLFRDITFKQHLFCVCVFQALPVFIGPCLCDQLSTKDSDLQKALLSCYVTSEVQVKWGLLPIRMPVDSRNVPMLQLLNVILQEVPKQK